MQPVVVEVKHRIRGFMLPPPLYDQSQPVVYCLMLEAHAGDLVQCVRSAAGAAIHVSRVDLHALISSMEEAFRADGRLTHVGLPTGNTLYATYVSRMLSKYSLDVEAASVRVGSLRFCPLLQFIDSTHLARRDAYRALFERVRFKNGEFIEDSQYAQEQVRTILRGGLAAHGAYDTWVLDDGVDAPIVCHLDGRDPLAPAKLRPRSRCAVDNERPRVRVVQGGGGGCTDSGCVCGCLACGALRAGCAPRVSLHLDKVSFYVRAAPLPDVRARLSVACASPAGGSMWRCQCPHLVLHADDSTLTTDVRQWLGESA